jgi:hypothetical protein
MERSKELEELMRGLYRAVTEGDVAFLDAVLSADDRAVAMGMDPEECGRVEMRSPRASAGRSRQRLVVCASSLDRRKRSSPAMSAGPMTASPSLPTPGCAQILASAPSSSAIKVVGRWFNATPPSACRIRMPSASSSRHSLVDAKDELHRIPKRLADASCFGRGRARRCRRLVDDGTR